MQRSSTPFVLAAAAGAALWLGASMLTGTREAWDAESYWSVVYPLALLVCAALGYFFAQRHWRWPLVVFGAQFVAMWIRNGELGALWPLGLALFGVLAVPGIAASRLGGWLRGRFARDGHDGPAA